MKSDGGLGVSSSLAQGVWGGGSDPVTLTRGVGARNVSNDVKIKSCDE